MFNLAQKLLWIHNHCEYLLDAESKADTNRACCLLGLCRILGSIKRELQTVAEGAL
jgi:hypothetical protein